MFFKGCTLHCPWCCNPETIRWEPETCAAHPNAPDSLWVGSLGIYGRWIEQEPLIEVLLKDRVYFESSGGGVTLSGGEPLAHPGIARLLGSLRSAGVHCAVETSLFVHPSKLEESVDLTDLFLVDIKILDEATCRDVLGGDLELYLRNADFLLERGAHVCFRMPVVKPYTMMSAHISRLLCFIVENRIQRLDLLPVHGLGKMKYSSLGLDVPHYPRVEEGEIEDLRTLILRATGAVAEVLK